MLGSRHETHLNKMSLGRKAAACLEFGPTYFDESGTSSEMR